jgi:predicted nucleotidyltransferase
MAETIAAEHEIEREIAALLADLERRFGERFVALYLFGSRARGDHEPESDVDVAVVLDQEMPRPFDVTREILEDTYDLLLDKGYYIQPWPLEKGSLDDPMGPCCCQAVNRAYCAMFYAAHAALEQRGVDIASSKHGTLVRRFGEHPIRTGILPRSLALP